ncbi:hypothetical protein [Hellea balneolensis]|uniref:hypothetical protein n=1 Tax=Hellea balneolensis TaxID=287478 RepID=UPI00047EE938|nr:hypothetical protein [Hellea balneolensis]
MSISKIKEVLKLFGFYYFSFFLVAVALLVLNALLFHFVFGIEFYPLRSLVQFILFLPFLVAVMAIGFDVWEGKLNEETHDR